jgi:hypothetical protein
MDSSNSAQGNSLLRLTTGILGSITLVADVLTIALFLRDVFSGNLLQDSNAITSRLLVTTVIFTLGILLITYARSSVPGFTKVTIFFAWSYITLSAILFAIISYTYVLGTSTEIVPFISLLILVILISGLGSITAISVNYQLRYFAIPYMLVAVLQALCWLFVISIGRLNQLNLSLVISIGLFVLSGTFIFLFLNEHRVERSTRMLVAIIGATLSFIFGFLIFSFYEYEIDTISLVLIVFSIAVVVAFFLSIYWLVNSLYKTKATTKLFEEDGYIFWFESYDFENDDNASVHVRRKHSNRNDSKSRFKMWLEPNLRLQGSQPFGVDLDQIRHILLRKQSSLVKQWHELRK